MAAFDDGDKTEDPTPTRLEEARSQGDVPRSVDFANFVVYVGFAMALYFASGYFLNRIIEILKRYFDFSSFQLNTTSEILRVFQDISKDFFFIIGPIFATVFVFGIASYLGQFGFLMATSKLSPDLSKLDPIQGFKKFLSRETFVELIKSTIKVFLICGLFYLILKGDIERLTQIGAEPVGNIFIFFVGTLAKVFMVMLIFMGVLGIADFAYQKWSYIQRHKMSVQEVKDENKQREGDPQIKGRIRQMQRDRARQRMFKEVPKADVVVTNPTHLAIAIKYERGKMKAPMIVAKGAGFIALKIKEIAIQSGVPVVEKKQLARFIFRHVEIGESIPETLYTAVAEVLAYVYKVKKKFEALKGRA